MALVVALVSVSSLAVQAFLAASTPNNSEWATSVQGSGIGYISALITNTGTRSGTLTDAYLHLPDQPSIYLSVGKAEAGAMATIPAGKSPTIRLVKKGVANVKFSPALTRDGAQCKMEYDFVNFDRTPSKIFEDTPCQPLEYFLSEYTHDSVFAVWRVRGERLKKNSEQTRTPAPAN